MLNQSQNAFAKMLLSVFIKTIDIIMTHTTYHEDWDPFKKRRKAQRPIL